MEGYTVWYYAAFVLFGLMWLSGVPALVAIGFLMARNPRRAQIWFAGALFGEAIFSAFFVLTIPWVHTPLTFDFKEVLPATAVLLAGVGQFIAALRGHGCYAAALALALAAVFVVFLNVRNPDWRGMTAALAGLALAMGSIMVTVIGFGAGQRKAEGTVGE